MKTFKEYIENSNIVLSEVKLTRVWKHLTDDDTAVGIITAFRGDKSESDNKKNNQKLMNELRKVGFGYFLVDGSWIENQGTSDEVEVSEDSVFVTAKPETEKSLFELLKTLAKKYNQDGFSWKPVGSSVYHIMDRSGKSIMKFSNVSFNKLADIYTKMRNKRGSFVFESAYVGAGFMGHVIFKQLKEQKQNENI